MLKQSSGLGLRGEGERTLMVIFFGANDAAAPDYHMHVPVDAYGENLRAMARRCQEMLPGITLVFVSPPPVDVDKLVEYVHKRQSPPGARLPVECLPVHADLT
jgi:lysophospholipase L1-like esterase